jgi:hypothetical protein
MRLRGRWQREIREINVEDEARRIAANIASRRPALTISLGYQRSLRSGDVIVLCVHDGVASMKKLSLAMAAMLALLSIAGCAQYVGKGKAPPPVVTKG